jgi:hypothetical protein
MNNPVRQKIAQRLSELKVTTGLTMAEVSRQLERNPAYLQQFISRGVPSELEERDRQKLALILQVNPEELRGPGRTRKWSRYRQNEEITSELQRSPNLFISHSSEEDSAQREFYKHFFTLFQDLNEKGRADERLKNKGFLPVYRLVQSGPSLRISILGAHFPAERHQH